MENQTPIAPVVTPQSNFLVILLSTLLIISIATAGFFAFQTQKLVKELQGIRIEENVAVATTEPTAEPVATNSATAITDSTKILKTADWRSPVAGICSEITKLSTVLVIVYEDNTTSPRCIKVSADQSLSFQNNSAKSIIVDTPQYKATIKSGASYQFPSNMGSFLEKGIHSIGGAEIWLQ